MDSSLFVDALRSYLNGSEWRASIRVFIAANCPFFSNIEQLHPHQTTVWKTFQEVAEGIVQGMLYEIGGSMEDLESAFDEILHAPSRGPKDEAIKDVLAQLGSVDDFVGFATGMNKACCELYDELGQEMENNTHDTCMRMGFLPSSIIDALHSVGKDGSFEDVLIYLTEHAHVGDAKSGSDAKPGSNGAADAKTAQQPPRMRFASAVDKFIAEAETENVRIDGNELHALFAIAESVIEAQRESLYTASAVHEHTNDELVHWAADLRELKQDLDIAYQEQIPCRDMMFHDPDGLVHWYRTLEAKRHALNSQASGAGDLSMLVSDAELQRMAQLDAIAAMGTASEQRLHGLISRYDTVQKEVAQRYRKLSLFMSTHRQSIRKDQVEHLYLFLKQQMSQEDGAMSLEATQFMATLSQSPEQERLLNLLLDINIHEDELLMLREEIHQLLGVPIETEAKDYDSKASTAVAAGAGDWKHDSTPASFPSASLLGPSETSLGGFDTASLGIGNETNAVLTFQSMLQQAEALAAQADEDNLRSQADAKGSAEQDFQSGMSDAQRQRDEEKHFAAPSVESHSTVSTSSYGHQSHHHSVNSDPDAANYNDRINADNRHHSDAVIDALKQKHRAAVQTLKDALDIDKRQRLQRLEVRLAMLKEQRLNSRGDLNREALSQLETALGALEAEKKILLEEHDTLKGSVMQGFKQRCILEMKAQQQQLQEDSAADSKATVGDAGSAAAAAVSSNAGQQAVQLLREQYETQTLQLLQQLQGVKERQKARLQERRRNHNNRRRGENGEGEGETAEDNAEEMKILQQLRECETRNLLALAAAQCLDPETLEQKKSKKTYGGGEGDYLNDDDDEEDGPDGKGRGGGRAKLMQWLEQLRRMREGYQDVSDPLRWKLITVPSAAASAEEAVVETATSVGTVQDVVTTSFLRALPALGDSTAGEVDPSDIQARLKSAFESAEAESRSQQKHKQLTTQQRLRARLAAQQQRTRSRFDGLQSDTAGDDVDEDADRDSKGSSVTSSPQKNQQLWNRLDAALASLPPPSALAVSAAEAAADHATPRRDTSAADDALQQDRMRAIKQSHETGQQRYVQEVQATMEQKKRNLEERLRQKRMQTGSQFIAGAAADDKGGAAPSAEESRQLQAELSAWDSAWQRFQRMLDTHSNAADWSPVQMERILDRIFREMLHGEGSNAAASEPAEAKSSAYASTLPSIPAWSAEDSAAISAHAGSSRQVSPRGESTPSGHSAAERERDQHEARRISTAYTQEQQRLDVALQIQHAKQRQKLQRKLYERSQERQQQQQDTQPAPRPLRPLNATKAALPGIAQFRSPSSILESGEERPDLIRARNASWVHEAKAAQEASQAVKGLAMPTSPLRADPKVGMSTRGMNLEPLQGSKRTGWTGSPSKSEQDQDG